MFFKPKNNIIYNSLIIQILNIVLQILFRVYNRFGQMVFETRDWLKQWDGKFKGQGADPATYVWMLSFINPDTGKRIEQKGTSILIR